MQARWLSDRVFPPSGEARGRQDFIFDSVKLIQIIMTRHDCNIALFAIARVAEISRSTAFHINEISNFLFYLKRCSTFVVLKFRFKRYPAKYKL